MPFPEEWETDRSGSMRPKRGRWKPRDQPPVSQAIETVYLGVTYRSRAEARWAYLFDLLKLKFLYEPGTVRTSLGMYLPDFLLPTQGCWIEVKGPHPSAEEKAKAASLARQTRLPTYIFSCGIPVIEATGQPRYDCATPPNHHSWRFSPSGSERLGYMFGVKECCGRIGIVFNGRTDALACDCEPGTYDPAYLRVLQRAFQVSRRNQW